MVKAIFYLFHLRFSYTTLRMRKRVSNQVAVVEVRNDWQPKYPMRSDFELHLVQSAKAKNPNHDRPARASKSLPNNLEIDAFTWKVVKNKARDGLTF